MVKFSISLILFCLFPYMTYARNVVFLHGGPGFNSKPESVLLKEAFAGHVVHFWNEPSELRMNTPYSTEDAFSHAFQSAREFVESACANCRVTLVGHSFAVHYVIRLASVLPHKIEKIVLLNPGIDMKAVDERILGLAVKGLADEGHMQESQELAMLMAQLTEAFDQNKMKAYSLASLYQGLFVNYWTRPELMMSYFSYLSGEYSFDAKAFFSVRMSMPHVDHNPVPMTEIPVSAYFGALDPVAPVQDQLPLLKKYFPNLDYHVLSGTRHYLHIERADEINY